MASIREGRLTVLVALFVLSGCSTAVAQTAARFAPVAHVDPVDTAGQLDLTEATFGQEDTRMRLLLRTTAAWNASDLSSSDGERALCVAVFYGHLTSPRARICVGARDGLPALTYLRLTPQGAVFGSAPLDALVSRPDPRTLVATFTPLAARLAPGHFAWRAESHWTDELACIAPDGCVDQVPDRAPVQDTVKLLAEPRCFGAAARDQGHPCQNPALRSAVVPAPSAALLMPNAFCAPMARSGLVAPCAFGVPAARATATVALIGDSHAEHWRGALEVVAQAKRWRGLSITRSSCPFSQGAPIPPHGRRARGECARWNREVPRWLRRHPEVHTIIVSANAVANYASSPQAGFQATWKALPASVRQVVVLRDTPRISAPQAACVGRALVAHRPAGRACAQPRGDNLPADPEAAAAYALGSRRVRVVDLTRFMCDVRVCFAVVGGALVRKDGTHLSATFATTLGPYVLRAIDRILKT
jgi:hypothetical protein